MPDKAEESRGQQRYGDVDDWPLPEIEAGYYLLGYLNQSGYSLPGFNGAEALTWSELQAWQQITMTPLTSWEAETMIELSRQYVNQLHKSRDANCPAPYTDDSADGTSQQQQRINNVLAALPVKRR